MKFLYIFPHPDDESFGPAPAIYEQIEKQHDVFLFTLTRGGATKTRHKLGLTVDQMGEIRYKEMLKMKDVLRLTEMTVLDLPDSGLQEIDPRELEHIVATHIQAIRPDIVITYPVHGVSGFHDHLVTHAIVKRVYMQLRDEGATYLKRLAFITLPNKVTDPAKAGVFLMKQSDPKWIDCEIEVTPQGRKAFEEALGCYETYRDMIQTSGILQMLGDRIYFEIYREDHKPPLTDLIHSLPS